jgi:two-component system sensor histidine kinase UhpB
MLVAVNAAIIRRAVTPLEQLTALMHQVDPLHPGQRLPLPGPPSEVTVLTEAFNEMLDRLERERREAGRRALSERELERRRLAAELHDQIGQTLTALALQADRLAGRADDGVAAEAADLRDGLLTSVEDVRRLAAQLRPEALDALGLVPALTNLAERISRRTGIEIVRHVEHGLPALDDDTELVIFRIAQESLTNAVRHAGAQVVELVLEADEDAVVLTVCDDGRGWRPGATPERGIRGMRERALSIGARFRIEPRTPNPGTRVQLSVPVRVAAPTGAQR